MTMAQDWARNKIAVVIFTDSAVSKDGEVNVNSLIVAYPCSAANRNFLNNPEDELDKSWSLRYCRNEQQQRRRLG